MRCFKPLKGYQSHRGGSLFFNRKTFTDKELAIRCGKCHGCYSERSRQWGIRMIHEAQLHDRSSFITLTYDDSHMPEDGSLSKKDLNLFMKRLRHHCGPYRYYACGEYGETTKRAHYHACIFGIDFPDKVHFKTTGNNHLYTSRTLDEIWGKGHCSVGSLTMQTAQYTASYMKKQFGVGAKAYYQLIEETGELISIEQPFAVMSLRPAIGLKWLHAFHDDIYGHDKDFVSIKGHKQRSTKYYDTIYDTINPEHLKKIKATREQYAKDNPITDAELRARSKIAHAQIVRKHII